MTARRKRPSGEGRRATGGRSEIPLGTLTTLGTPQRRCSSVKRSDTAKTCLCSLIRAALKLQDVAQLEMRVRQRVVVRERTSVGLLGGLEQALLLQRVAVLNPNRRIIGISVERFAVIPCRHRPLAHIARPICQSDPGGLDSSKREAQRRHHEKELETFLRPSFDPSRIDEWTSYACPFNS